MSSSSNRNKICAVIPFYNEKNTIYDLVAIVAEYCDTVIAVDDGSDDGFEAGGLNGKNVIVLKHEKRKGKGTALRTGFLESIRLNCEITITLDADFQHDPGLIPDFIEGIKDRHILIGDRMTDPRGMPIHRKLSNILTSKMLSLKTGEKIRDSQCGFRAFRKEILNKVLPDYSGFEAESEMIVKGVDNSLNIGFISIPALYNSNRSKMRSFSTIYGFLKVFFFE